MKKRIADNAEYANRMEQISFLDDGGCIRPDCVCRSDSKCKVCERPLPPLDKAKVLYWIAGEPTRICGYCYRHYKRHWSFHLGKSLVRKNTYKVFEGGENV